MYYYSDGTASSIEDQSKILHRDNDLPAIELKNGHKAWFQNGLLRRDNDLPTIEFANGSKYWYKEDKLHRDNGLPAVEISNGRKYWYLNGNEIKHLTKSMLIKRMIITGESIADLLLHPEDIIRKSAEKYKWKV